VNNRQANSFLEIIGAQIIISAIFWEGRFFLEIVVGVDFFPISSDFLIL